MKTLSDDYQGLLEKQIKERPDFGESSLRYAPMVAELINSNSITQVLDYGAGEGQLVEALKPHLAHDITVQLYEPALANCSERPVSAEMVTCIDVLHCVEPDYIDSVLDDLKALTKKMAFLTILTEAADLELLDGRNTALIQSPAEWWLSKLMERFTLWYFSRVPKGFVVVLEALDRKVSQNQ